jgi:DNA-binding MarR family transcriptional regulator
MTGTEDREKSLLRLADELSTEIATLATLMRQPLLHREVSIQRVRVMAHLLNQGPLPVTQLAVAEDVTQPTMTAMVTNLVKSGLVTRTNDSSDGRVRLVALTSKGERIVRNNRSARAADLAEKLSQLDDNQLRLLEALVPTLSMLIELLSRTA